MKSNCNKCMHKEMCKYKDNINDEEILAKMQADYPFVAEIDFSCRYFEKREKGVVTEPAKEPGKKGKTSAGDAKKTGKSEVAGEYNEFAACSDAPVAETPADSPENGVDSFEDIKIADFGLDEDTTGELIGLGGEGIRIRDLRRFSDKMSPDCKRAVTTRLQAFNYNI